MSSRILPSFRVAGSTWVVILLLLRTSALVCAQTAPQAANTSHAGVDLIEESEFKIRLLEENGELVEVPGFTRREFLELLDLQRRLKEQREDVPRVAFGGTIELTGNVEAESDHATCEVAFKVVVTRRDAEDTASWLAVPLRLDNSFVDAATVEHEGEGEFFLDRQGDAFVGWLNARPGTEHILRLRTRVRLPAAGTERTFSLKLPNMTTRATLLVAGPPVETRVTRTGDSVSVQHQPNGTLISVENGGGSLEMAWLPRLESKPFLESNGTLVYQILGHRVWCETQLKVRSRGAPIDSFVVHLPRGMELSPRNEPGYVASLLPNSLREGRQSVLVKRLAGETLDPLQVRLEAALPELPSEQPSRLIDLSGFEVEGARPQWGTVDVSVEGNWSVNWRPGGLVQRTAVPEAARPQLLTGRFLYDRQPFELAVELRQKQPRIAVTAAYGITVQQALAAFEGRLRYTTTGAQLQEAKWNVSGWTIDEVLPAELLTRPFTVDGNSVLTIPLGSAPAEFELRIKAHRELPSEDGGILIPLPRPSDSTLIPSTTVAVSADESIELTPRLAISKYLIQETQPPAMELPPFTSPPLFYREELSTEDAAPAQFAADKRARPRETTLAVETSAQIRAANLVISQKISGNVAHQPLRELMLELPRVVLQSGTLKLGQDGEQLPYALLTGADSNDPSLSLPRMVAEFSAERLGALEVAVSYELPMSSVISAAGLRIPLVQPYEDGVTRVTGNLLTISPDEETVVKLADERWFLDSDPVRDKNGGVRARAVGKMAEAVLNTSQAEHHSQQSTAIPKAWIQTWLTATDRRDRVCFQLQGDEKEISVQLPSAAEAEDLRVVIDGESQEPRAISESGLLRIARQAEPGTVSHIELWYWSRPPAAGQTTIQAELPQVVGADRIERVYWQLILPRNRLLIWRRPLLTSESAWQLADWYRGTRGRLGQAELEDLFGAQRSDAIPAATNQYLFSGTGAVQQIAFATVDRTVVMLLTSGAALVLLLPSVYWPWLRQPVLFLLLGLVLAFLAVTYPEPAAVCGQAVALGLAMGLLGILIHQFAGTPVPEVAPRQGSVYIVSDSQVSPSAGPTGEGSSRATTESAPAHLRVARVQGET